MNFIAQLEAIYRERERAIWDWLALSIEQRTAVRLPDCARLPDIYDPYHLLAGEHTPDGYVHAHPAYDYFPSPTGGIQHGVDFRCGRFAAHGVPASLNRNIGDPARIQITEKDRAHNRPG
jgi:hypothetical protein